MAVIGRYANRNVEGKVVELILTVDAAVVGAITLTAGGHYQVQTKGLVPTIDSITGASFNEAWAKIAERVRCGGVFFTRLITDVSDVQRA